MATATQPITAEEFARLPSEPGHLYELVRGGILEMNLPIPRHGEVCGNISFLIKLYLQKHPVGRVVTNDSGIVTERDPDTVRGADVAFYSYSKVPAGPLPAKYLSVVPDIAFEVKSPSDRWSSIYAKVAEYLEAGVAIVCVVDPEDETVRLHFQDRPEQIFTGEDLVKFPEPLPGFEAPARLFFE